MPTHAISRAHTHTHTHTHTHARAHAKMNSHTHTYTHTHMHSHTHTYTHTHMHSHTHTLTHALTYTHARTHTQFFNAARGPAWEVALSNAGKAFELPGASIIEIVKDLIRFKINRHPQTLIIFIFNFGR